MELFFIAGSPFSWRIQLAFAIHGIDYVPRQLQASEGEHKQPDYLALNPRGTVPTIRDEAFVLRESLAILVYLNGKYSWQLFGTSPSEQGQIWQETIEIENVVASPILDFGLPILLGELDEHRDRVLASAKLLETELSRLNSKLGQQSWLVGDRLSAAEIVAYPLMRFLDRVGGREQAASLELDMFPLQGKYPHIETWSQRLEALPGVKDTYPPNWRD